MARTKAVAATLLLAAAVGCTGDDDVSDEPRATENSPDTTRPALQFETIPPGTTPDENTEFLAGVLADDTVTVEELDEAYGRFVACLDDGGGHGRYAYDIALRTGLVVDWSINPDEPDARDVDELDASCSRQFLGDLTDRYHAANPPSDDYGDDVRNSVVGCLETVSPTAAANFPDDVAVDTSGAAASVGELQLSAVGLVGEDATDTEEAGVNACIASLGAEWHDFGERPAPTTTG